MSFWSSRERPSSIVLPCHAVAHESSFSQATSSSYDHFFEFLRLSFTRASTIVVIFLFIPSVFCSLRPRPNVELFMRRTELYFRSTWSKLRSSVRSDVELGTRRTNQMNQNYRKRLNIHYHTNFWFSSLVYRVWTSMFVPETIFRCSIRLKQTERTCWTIQTHSDEPTWARRRTFHGLNSLKFSHVSYFPCWLQLGNNICPCITTHEM